MFYCHRDLSFNLAWCFSSNSLLSGFLLLSLCFYVPQREVCSLYLSNIYVIYIHIYADLQAGLSVSLVSSAGCPVGGRVLFVLFVPLTEVDGVMTANCSHWDGDGRTSWFRGCWTVRC